MEDDIILYLPWPPTINDYYGTNSYGARFIKQKARKFREACEKALHEQYPHAILADRLLVEVVEFPPDRRKRDLDNYMKGLLDGCTVGKLWIDDSIIDQLFIYRGEVVKGGCVKVSIGPAGPIIKFDLDQSLGYVAN